MDKITKNLKKLNEKERKLVKDILSKILARNLVGINLKKLRGSRNIFRVRKGTIRVIYKSEKTGKIYILSIERRSKRTYSKF
jgi:mRNA-degrading endonuclease RelE of RelBE toxin-antitoxin system